MATRSKKEEPIEPSEDAPEGDAPPDGVLVLVERQENGGITTDAQPLGDVRIAEVETILELGRQGWRSKIGLGKG